MTVFSKVLPAEKSGISVLGHLFYTLRARLVLSPKPHRKLLFDNITSGFNLLSLESFQC